ncbi:MAG: hypothetical protein K5924_03025 [Chloroflexi bacterium]|nr:hypothetical protein [Chloroflexota bacterium]
MDLVVLALSAVIGFGAGYAWVATQNPFAPIAVVGIGGFLLFGVTSASGPGPVLDAFVETVGIAGLVAAIVGAVAGGYVADRSRSDQAA